MKDLANRYGIHSMSDLIAHYERKTNGLWFDAETMRFFRSRLSGRLHYGREKIYFCTSERRRFGSRRYSVRAYSPETGEIETIGDYQQYESLAAAHKAAKRLADEERASEILGQ